jgi:glycosyltransferase involved in cell wall biosynthesis
MMSEYPLVTIVVPIFNEQENIRPFYEAVNSIMTLLKNQVDYEILFTDNHSTDDTLAILSELANSDPKVRVIRFSKNFGYQKSIWTGYCMSRGDAAVQMDCDLQDPPEMIREFIHYWKLGYKVVYGVRLSRASESLWLQYLRKCFYRAVDHLCDEETVPHHAGDFRLVDKCIIQELKNIHDYNPYLRGTIANMGFSQLGIPYHRRDRIRGNSKFSAQQLISLAIDGILSHSTAPLRLAIYTGLIVALLTFFGMCVIAACHYFYGQSWPSGFATMAILILFGISLNAIFLGIIGEYIGRIYYQMKGRPITIIETTIPRKK